MMGLATSANKNLKVKELLPNVTVRFWNPHAFIAEPLAPTRRGPVQGIVLLWGKSDNAAPVSTKNCIPVDLSWSWMKFTEEKVAEVAMALTRIALAAVCRLPRHFKRRDQRPISFPVDESKHS